jgi:hypothetical protein
MVNGPGFLPGALFCYVRILLLYLFKLKIMNKFVIKGIVYEIISVEDFIEYYYRSGLN